MKVDYATRKLLMSKAEAAAAKVPCTCGGLCHTHVGLTCARVQEYERALELAWDEYEE